MQLQLLRAKLRVTLVQKDQVRFFKSFNLASKKETQNILSSGSPVPVFSVSCVKDMDSKVNEIDTKYSKHSPQLVNLVHSLAQKVKWIQSFAHEYDYDQVTKSNGFRSFAKLIDRFFDLLLEQQLPNESTWFKWFRSIDTSELEELEKLARAIDFVGTFFEQMRDQLNSTVEKEGIESIFSTSNALNHQLTCHAFENIHHLRMFIGKYANFHYEPYYRIFLRGYMSLIGAFWSKLTFGRFFNFLTSHYKHVASQFIEMDDNFDLEHFCRLFHYTDEVIIKTIAPFILFGPFKAWKGKTKHFTVPLSYSIDPESHQIIINQLPSQSTIKCRFIFHTLDQNNNSIVFHVHGGAFLFGSPEASESLTGNWASKLKTVPVLSVQYSLAPEKHFPTALEELLNLYLFLTKNDHIVKEQLGFVPKKFIFTGDSAGGNMILALTCILNDIAKYFDATVQLPSAIVSIYSINILQSLISPSRLFTAFDVILPLSLFFEVGSAYSGFRAVCEGNNNQMDGCNNNSSGNNNSRKNSEEKKSSGKTTWYKCRHCSDVFSRFQAKLAGPYCSPMNYRDFDSLSNVDLHLIVGEFDLFLDENIALAKMWKGKVTLDVVDDMGHGFLHFLGASRKIASANDLCVKRLYESVESVN